MNQQIPFGSLRRVLAGATIAALALTFGGVNAAKAQTYSIDDGTAENSIGLTNGGTAIFLNSFTVTPGLNIIDSVSISFGSAGAADLIGLTYTAVLWSDPNGDGLPGDAVVLASTGGTITTQNTNTFQVSMFNPTLVLTQNFFVGFVITHAAGQFPASFDQTAPTFTNRSFVNTGGNINNLAGSITIESAGLSGNWMIRANAIPEPSTYALMGLGLLGLIVWQRRRGRASA